MPIELGFGPYESNAPIKASTAHARIYFFRAVEWVEPQVIASLHEEVFINFLCAVYVNLESRIKPDIPFDKVTMREALQGIRNNISTEEINSLIPNPNALNEIKNNFNVYARLKAWAEKWGLQEEWCLDYALRAMRMWLYWETQRALKSWRRADSSEFVGGSSMTTDALYAEVDFIAHINFLEYVGGGDLTNTDFTFEYNGVSYRNPGWSPLHEDAGEWKKKVKGEFRALLRARRAEGKPAPKGIMEAFDKSAQEYVGSLKSAAKKYGLKVTPRKRDYDHFLWLVHYQVQQPHWSLNQIAEKYNGRPENCQ